MIQTCISWFRWAMRRWQRWLLVGLCMGVLQGCAMTRLIDSEVRTSASASSAPQRPATYRFERMPSQLASAQTDMWEAQATQVLQQVGLTQDSVQPRYAVMWDVQVNSFERSPSGPGFWGGFGLGHRGFGAEGFGLGWRMGETWWRVRVQFVLRDLQTQQLAYDASAVFEGPWGDTARIVPIVMQAALQDYPLAAPQPRRVVIELPPSDEE